MAGQRQPGPYLSGWARSRQLSQESVPFSSHMALKLKERPGAQETMASLSTAFWSEQERQRPHLVASWGY